MDRLRIIYKAFVGWVTPARFINIIFGILLVGSFISIVYATTPNPGHPWTELGDGVFKITGPTALRTFTFPDATSTVLTTNDVVTLAQGGTNANLTASNGGIFYSTDSAGAILSGTATAGQILRSGTSDAPSWSTATYPATSEASKYILTSDGTNFVSTAPDSMITTITRSYNATGASTTFSLSSNTSFRIGMFSVPASITVNQISILPGTITMNMGGLKICIYSGDGATKIIDQTTALPVASTILTTTISSPATLPPGNYYIAVGCVSSMCGSLNVTSFTSTAIAFENGATVPSGKMVYEGTGTMTAGTCNATLPTITGAVSSTVNARLDN